jgi:xylan 1,4-beta-xylosidase
MVVNFSCNISTHAKDFPHYWETVVGSGHATLGLRADWQTQLTRCHQELGFNYVRFHGILSDDMGTLMCENNELIYSFFNADQIFDFLASIGMKPFVELSFMPTALSSGGDTVFHYRGNVTPPKDYNAWEELIRRIVQHWVDRFGTENVREWFFEVWNEPNLPAFWKGSQQDYFLLYQHTARAIKSVDEKLRVGGPATADNEWITDFYNYCTKNSVPFDFISTHQYPTDAFGKPGDDTLTQLADSTRSVLRAEVIKTKEQAGDKPVYYTEWSTSSNPFDPLHDQEYASAFIIKTIMEASGYLEGYSYWIFSDIFEENYFSSEPFHGGFGLMNIYGIPKPAYRAFEILHRLGTDILPVEGQHPTLDVWVVRNTSAFNIVITNAALPRHAINEESVSITLNNIPPITRAFVERIDGSHANATAAWQKMGSPSTLHPLDVKDLENASQLVQEPIAFEFEKNTATLNLQLPPQGAVLITLLIK